jgi:hypothetical protein
MKPGSAAILAVIAALAGGCPRPGAQCERDRQALRDELRKARDEARALVAERDQLQADLALLREKMKKQKVIVEMAGDLVRIRGLRLRRPLRVAWVSAEKAREHMKKELAREVPKDFERRYVDTLSRLGLLPRGYRLLQSFIELMDEQAAGFYDPRLRKLFIRRDMPAGEVILSHEIAHALQDQSYALKALHGDRKDHDDRSFAVRALIEGDATLTMVSYLRRNISLWKVMRMLPDLLKALFMDDTRLKAAPAYVRAGLVEPYLKGLEFVQHLKRVGGWARVNQAFRRLPASSEQILHPQKYVDGEQPVKVTIPDLAKLVRKASLLHENTLGEIGVSVLLSESAGTLLAGRAASGWGGDRVRSYRRADGQVLLVWRSAWDSRADALQFVDGMLLHLEGRYGRGRNAVRQGGRGDRMKQIWRTRGGVAILRVKGSEVVLVDNARDVVQARAIAKACGL